MTTKKITTISIGLFLLLFGFKSNAQIVLLGENPPHGNVNDGDFSLVWDYWRNASQSPFWVTKTMEGKEPMGLHYGTLFSSNTIGIADSKTLNTNPDYQNPKIGDTLLWSFGADLEYHSKGTLSLSLVFGKQERLLAEKVKLIGQDKTIEHFSGSYIITAEDSQFGLPFVRATFYSEQDVKVYLHYVNISVATTINEGPQNFKGKPTEKGIHLTWTDAKVKKDHGFNIYRRSDNKKGYDAIGYSKSFEFTDSNIINGIIYNYLVTRESLTESAPSTLCSISRKDTIPPNVPTNIKTEIFDTEIKISWVKNLEKDISHYSVYRSTPDKTGMEMMETNILKTWFEDLRPYKETEHSYVVFAHDYSGNKSKASAVVKAKVKTVYGASFKDLILPMPIYNRLQRDVWGAENVIPRDIENGIEDPKWSYWGGRPMKDKDEKYHMLVVRWPEDGLKGHWEWPNSTVVHSVSDLPTGPYIATNDKAYTFENGLGHNADVTQLNDGRFLLYSLINWEPTLFTSNSMNGPWKREGIMIIEYDAEKLDDEREYQVQRNLSGLQLADGSMLFVSKFGRMIKSEHGLLGPYKVLTDVVQKNTSIPERYRLSNYEDPVMWKDGIQFHCLINAFLDKRAIYLRSADGINWKFDPGIAYDTHITQYEDGTKTHWYKLERPHVIQDEFGRATHLSVAALDVPKRDDFSNDNHNSKNIIIPLTVHKRFEILNKKPLSQHSKTIKILIHSEEGFNAQTDIDLASLRLGASEEVNYGRGCKVITSRKKGKDLIVEFEGKQHGLTSQNFACKLLGKTKSGDLLIAFSNL